MLSDAIDLQNWSFMSTKLHIAHIEFVILAMLVTSVIWINVLFEIPEIY